MTLALCNVDNTVNSNDKRPTVSDPGGKNSPFSNKLLKAASNNKVLLPEQLEVDFEEEEVAYKANISHLYIS
jgi:hypothetical protein